MTSGNESSLTRTLNPTIEVAVRTHSEDEAALLAKEALGQVFFGEEELAGHDAPHSEALYPARRSNPPRHGRSQRVIVP